MRRIPFGMLCILAGVVAAAAGRPARAASENLLPDTTRGFVAVPDFKKLSENWKKTQIGQLVQDPVMKPFVDDLQRQFEERAEGMRDRIGLTVDDLRDVPGGEVALAAVQPAAGKHATVVLVDIAGHRPQADALLKKVAASMAKQGAKQRQVQSGGATLVVYDLPAPEGQPAPPAPRQAIYFVRENMLVAADDLAVVEGVLGRLAGQGGKSLADVPGFQAVMKRVQAGAGKAVPQVRWWLQPIGYIEVAQAARAERGEGDRPRKRKRTVLDAFKATGFGALQGIGGYVEVAPDKQFDLYHRTAIHAPPPYQGTMKALAFPNGKEFTPQPWVPRDVAAYASLQADVLNAFDNFAPLFDELYNDGESGMWAEIVEGLKTDKHGPKVDLRNELIARLGPRVSVVTDYQLPITTSSERLLVAVEAKDEKAVAAAIAKLFKNDPDMRKRTFPPEKDTFTIWESVPPEKTDVPTLDLSLPDIGGGPKHQPKEEARERSILPNQAITVAHGNLLIASHYDFLTKILQQSDARASLAKTVDYQLVDKTLDAKAPPARAAESFSRSDETLRPTYELVRQGKMPQSEMLFGRVLNTALGPGKKGVPRKQEIEGSKMPDFDYVRRHLAPGGASVVSEEQGWYVEGFLLGKQ